MPKPGKVTDGCQSRSWEFCKWMEEKAVESRDGEIDDKLRERCWQLIQTNILRGFFPWTYQRDGYRGRPSRIWHKVGVSHLEVRLNSEAA